MFALGFAAVAVVVTRRTYQIESERDRVDAQARETQESFARRAQAGLVSAWWGRSLEGQWGAFVRNTSEIPVYQAYLTVLGRDDHSDDVKFHYLVLPPSSDALFCSIGGDGQARAEPARRVKLSFTDAAGVRWLRNQYGSLTELQPNLLINADSLRAEVLARFESDFLATYGVTVAFDTDSAGRPQQQFVADFEESSVVDALICPHDWIGDLVSRDVVEPTVLSAEHRHAFPGWALSALSVDDRLYGIPTTVDTVALIRNTLLAPQPPSTFDELLATGQALRDAGRVAEVFTVRVGQRGDPFQIWPLFTSAGGWLFGVTPDGRWDPTRIGLATAESIAAFERLREFGEAGAGLLRRSMSRDAAIELFATARSPYLISSSDALQRLRQTNIPIAVSAVPPFSGGAPAAAFTLVHGLVMAKHGLNKIIAHDLFADYLTHDHVMTALSDGIVAPVALVGSTNENAAIRQFLELCERGTPMPSFPQMDAIWRILEDAEIAVVCGASAEATARRAAASVAAIFTTEEGNSLGRPVVA
ncbi:MAG TPA: extracellular solute-binding protein [Streptomyces sp.]|nr:extracellular solute-binding protein [Streptomyces sp.]